MLLLGIDTSGKNASAAIFDSETEIFRARKTVHTTRTHSQIIMPMCMDLLKESDLQMSDISAFAAASGPGSYTGLRIGVAAVKAMSFALGCKCSGVSTLEAAAYNNAEYQGTICTIMKARADLVYTCTYRSDGYQPVPVTEERIISRSELAEELAFRGEKALLCGDGAADFFTEYRSASFFIAPPHTRFQDASGVCLAAMAHGFYDPDELEVSYLQKVKAEKDLEKKSEQVPNADSSSEIGVKL